jgi:cytochrome c oxidase subunit 2
MRHFITVGILVIVAAVLTYAGLNAAHLMPVEASAQAVPIDWLWNWEVMTISFLFALIVVPIIYSLFVFRRKKGDTSDAEHIEGNTKLEIAWTIIPLFIVMVFAYMGAYSLAETRRVDPQAMVINVTASQWAWSFEYPDYGIVSDKLYLPKDKQVLLMMQSRDVIHSFWVPEFRVKQDVVPGRITEYRITPTLVGSYKVRCAELCGTSHAYMESPVIVVSSVDFIAWVDQQKALASSAAQTPEGAGELLVKSNGCLGCHTVNGSKLVGPTWQGLFGSQVALSDGSTVTADEAYIKQSILDPQVQIVAGYEGQLMPNVYSFFSEEELANIIAYIKSLK